jgi:hypothetical protein
MKQLLLFKDPKIILGIFPLSPYLLHVCFIFSSYIECEEDMELTWRNTKGKVKLRRVIPESFQRVYRLKN